MKGRMRNALYGARSDCRYARTQQAAKSWRAKTKRQMPTPTPGVEREDADDVKAHIHTHTAGTN
eukprot:15455023-Alexandrium_andersonii.AAC.1